MRSTPRPGRAVTLALLAPLALLACAALLPTVDSGPMRALLVGLCIALAMASGALLAVTQLRPASRQDEAVLDALEPLRAARDADRR